MPRKPSHIDLRSIARSYTHSAIRTLVGIMTDADCPPAARVSAAEALLDRGWGRPVQQVSAEGGALVIEVVRFAGGGAELRVVGPGGAPGEPPLIEAGDGAAESPGAGAG